MMKRSVITVIFSFNIELINLLVSEASLLIIFVESLSRLSFALAQIAHSLTLAQGCIISELFFAVSVTKILLVTNFSWIFPYDPNQLGKVIICLAMAVAILPSSALCFYDIVQGKVMTNMVAYMAKIPYCKQETAILQVYLIFWILLAFSSLVFTLLYVPHYLQTHANSLAIQTGESNEPKKEVSLKRIILGFIGILFHVIIVVISNYTGLFQGLPINAFSITTTLNLMLVFFVLDDSVWDDIKVNLSKTMFLQKICIRGNTVTPEPHVIHA